MGTGGRPGKFPAKVIKVTKTTVTFEASPEDLEYLKNQVGEIGIVEWTPNSYKSGSGAPAESPD
jgi:hypothetical protein